MHARALDAALPGEAAPLLPLWAAQYVAVADLAAARTLVTGNGLGNHHAWLDAPMLAGATAAERHELTRCT